jgi:hypothetical protein
MSRAKRSRTLWAATLPRSPRSSRWSGDKFGLAQMIMFGDRGLLEHLTSMTRNQVRLTRSRATIQALDEPKEISVFRLGRRRRITTKSSDAKHGNYRNLTDVKALIVKFFPDPDPVGLPDVRLKSCRS